MSPELAITDSVEQIPTLRLYKQIRDHQHRELDSKGIVVCAIIDGKVAGVGAWTMPRKLWRSESLGEAIYRKGVQYKDALEDWLFPSFWYDHGRREQFQKAQEDCMEKFLGAGAIDEMWYLKVLAVHPGYQRKGVGAALLDWGLKHARARGEKAYLEATPFGKGLYLKKGFTTVGELHVGEEGDEVRLPCMLWDPASAPSDDQIALLTVPDVEKQA
jgi:ribosomal protein S18 acetylase RimI-like enzyme